MDPLVSAVIALAVVAGLAVVLSVAAVFFSLRRSSTAEWSRLKRSIDEALIELYDLRELYGRVMASNKRLRARIGADKRRLAELEEETPQSPEEFKRQARLKLHVAKFNP